MNRSTKIIIGVVVVVVIGVGYVLLSNMSNNNLTNAYQNASQQGSPSLSNQMNRALHESGILPHDGGGG